MSKVIDQALDVVNVVRTRCGLQRLETIAQGRRGDGLTCPIAMSLPDDPCVGTTWVQFQDEEAAKALALAVGTNVIHIGESLRPWRVKTRRTPIADFVDAFDSGDEGMEQFEGTPVPQR